MKTDFLVYAHYNFKGQVFYIGKGSLKRARERCSRSNYWKSYVAKHGLVVKIWAENLTEQQAFAMEKEWIALYGRKHVKTGMLVNLSEGGEGPSGVIPSAETIEKRRLKNVGQRRTEEQRAKFKITNKNNTFSEQARLAAKDALKNRVWTKEMSEEHSKLLKGIKKPPRTPEHAQKIAEANKGKIPTDELRKKLSEANKGQKRTPEQLINYTNAARARAQKNREQKELAALESANENNQ